MSDSLSAGAKAVHARLDSDFLFFAKHAPLFIKDKVGRLVKFELNIAQRYLHDKLEAQKKKFGWVRAVVVKGRQQGCSTYIIGRDYHRVTRNQGISAFLLSHEAKSTDKLFGMLKRYYDHCRPELRPALGVSNQKQQTFPGIQGDYTVATAKNEDAGRSGTSQIIHWSEVAYTDNADAIQDAALQTVVLLPGTEIVLESTANGPRGLFYRKFKDALRGIGDYILIFIPWFWQEEYERDPGADFQPTEEEEKFIKIYFSDPFPYSTTPISRAKALRKLAWRRTQFIELCTGANIETGKAKFREIYPSNPTEAFQASGVGLFRADAVMAARKAKIQDESAPLIIGVDPAGDSDNADRTVITLRRGRAIENMIKYERMKPMRLAGILAGLIDTARPDMMFIDRAYGEGTIDRLHEMGYGERVQGVHFSERTLEPHIYANKRSEIIVKFAEWVNAGDVSIPDEDEIHADLAAIPIDKTTSNGLKLILPKTEIKKNNDGRSTDFVDSGALTFSYPVRRADIPTSTLFRKADSAHRWVSGRSGNGPLKSRAFFGRRRS